MKMKMMKMTAALMVAGGLIAGAQMATAVPAVPDAAQVKATHDLLAAMQAEKMMRMTAGGSHYADDKQRQAVMDKLNKTPPEDIYRRLAVPLARIISTETATEMTKFYLSDYGQRVLKMNYNSGAQLYPTMPTPTPAEKEELKRPAYLKADQALKEAEPAIHHEEFVLVTEIANGK
ncbi:hypothetical protein [Rugamonas sp.]|uniref:hypothetical protein n=1 Tax=Rugamonas sp. TaxID=1926287 RepID=UPI0025D8A931|nr:hypothetical protein [Rugamonas sp.]